jgi:glycosyltransferase involved in cell wall biosynthesis
MRVLHVDSSLGWRGGQNQVILTAQGMAASGHVVTVVCRAGGALEGRVREAGLDAVPVVFSGDAWPQAAWSLARVARAIRPDIVHLHDPNSVGAGVIARRLLGLRAPLIASRRVDFAMRGTFSRLKYRSCERVVAVSRAIAAVLEAGGLPPGRIRLVYEGVPDRPPLPGGSKALRELGVPADALVVGNIAALTDHKDHATLVEAAALVLRRVPSAAFVVLGEGDLRPHIESRMAALGIGDRFVLAGFRADVDRLLPAFSVLCLSSHMEGLGTSLLDGMAFRLPIVATAAGGISEAVDDGVTGRLVPARDPEALANALTEVLLSSELRARMGCAGRRRFEERFTAERMVDATMRVYEEVA